MTSGWAPPGCHWGSVALLILDAANHVCLGVGHHGQLNDAVDDGVQGEEVIALDDRRLVVETNTNASMVTKAP